jgi:putative DNA primase/helicase
MSESVIDLKIAKAERRKAALINGGGPETLDGLSALSPVEYGRIRDDFAARLGTPVKFLDDEYKERRKGKSDDEGDALPSPDPWAEPVDGAELLDKLTKTAASHLILPSGAAETIALWTLFAHAHDSFHMSPVLGITSPTPECGKTTVLTFLGAVVPRCLPAANITPAAVFRAVEKWSPTLLIDEADTFLRDNNELRGILNSGHNRGCAFVIRTTGDNYEPKRFCTWAPKAVALIGKLPATLASRAIHIALRRKMPSETVTELRPERRDHLIPLCRQAARWTSDNADKLRLEEPRLPANIYGRTADNWRPLLAIADVAGGHWPEVARGIAQSLNGKFSEETAGIMLLDDLRRIFAKGKQQITSVSLVETLVAMEDRPWPEWKNGRPITARQVAKLLDPFEIRPGQVWEHGKNLRGYERAQFDDAFSCYLGTSPSTSASPLDPLETGAFSEIDPLGSKPVLADRNDKKPRKPSASSGLADRNPLGGDWDPFRALADDSLKLR